MISPQISNILGTFSMVYDNHDINNLNDGDYYFDTRDNNYYVYYHSSSIQIVSNTTISTNSYSNPSYINSSISYSNGYNKEELKEYLKNNPELLDELICEIRREKIEKILKNENR